MADIVKFDHIKVKPADNGWVLEYTEISKRDTAGTFDDTDWHDRQMVFGEDQLDDAMNAMKKLLEFNKMKKGGNPMAPPKIASSDSPV